MISALSVTIIYVNAGRRMPDQYTKILERSPVLLDRLREAQGESLSLRSEAALARALLGHVLSVLAQAHGRTGKLDADALGLVLQQLEQVSRIVEKGAGIEAKRDDQRIEISKLVILMSALRDDLRRNLKRAGLEPALEFVDAAFARARWTGELSEEAVNEVLAAPASYNVEFRPIEREGDKLVEREKTASDPAAIMRLPTVEQAEAIKAEIADLEADVAPPPRNGNGNGNAKRNGGQVSYEDLFDDGRETEEEDDGGDEG